MAVNTIVESGRIRVYRELAAGDIDAERALIELRNTALAPTMLDGHMNSVRVNDADPAVAERLVVRGDGVNTLLADSGAIATSEGLLGMVITDGADGLGNARYATHGSIIDGFAGALVKHAVYYLGPLGTIQLSPGVVEVIVGIAVDEDKFLFVPCCCEKVGSLALNYCFSSVLFDCEHGAVYCLEGPGFPECLPVLRFGPDDDANWYCGFETPNAMDTTQDGHLELQWFAGPAPANPIQWSVNLRSVGAGGNVYSGGAVYAPPPLNPVPPGANTLATTNIVIPANSLTSANLNRLTLSRQASNPSDTYAGPIFLASAQLRYVSRCSI